MVEVLMKLAQNAGVEFMFDASVERVDVNSTHARAVFLDDGQRLTADAVLANADLPYIYNDLLPDRKLAASILAQTLLLLGDQFLLGSG